MSEDRQLRRRHKLHLEATEAKGYRQTFSEVPIEVKASAPPPETRRVQGRSRLLCRFALAERNLTPGVGSPKVKSEIDRGWCFRTGL
jgi:hypothetical protein